MVELQKQELLLLLLIPLKKCNGVDYSVEKM